MKGVPNISWEAARLYAKMFISRSSLLGTSTELASLSGLFYQGSLPVIN